MLHSGQHRDHDISDLINVHICNEAAKVVATERDERRYTLTAILFLECLHCDLKFRYGEKQKYWKHCLDIYSVPYCSMHMHMHMHYEFSLL